MTKYHQHSIHETRKDPIETALFDMLKCGPGPSSSHTIGPMQAAYNFVTLCNTHVFSHKPARFMVRLFGSLSATGKGHGTDIAIIAGLLGTQPAKCPPTLLKEISANPEKAVHTTIGGVHIPIFASHIVFDAIEHTYPFTNTMIIDVVDAAGKSLLSREYYSVGGGFIQWRGQEPEKRGKPKYAYNSMTGILATLKATGLSLPEMMLENEMAITGFSRIQIREQLDEVMDLMLQSVERGLSKDGILPGYLQYPRQSKRLLENGNELPYEHDRFLARLNAYALAVAEENADGGVIVTGPTCGSAGVIPAILYVMKHQLKMGVNLLREGLLAAVCIGFLCKHNSSIAGAEVGCQGEIGVACAMAAAMLTHAKGHPAKVVANAAEIALEHFLGMTCDPVGGLVIIPCIERNAIGAIKAYNATILATTKRPQDHRVRLDYAISAMNEIGRDMNIKFKETSLGGLATSYINC